MNVSVARNLLRHASSVSMRRTVLAISPRHYGIMMMNNRNGLKSSAAMRQFSVASHAHELLQKELDEEVENNSTEMPQDLKVLQKKISANWTIVDEDMNGTVKLFSKDSTSPKVSIVFHCQDTLESEYEEEEEQEGEEGLEPAMPVRFTVTASKAGKTMVLACLSEQAEASIETVAITSNLEYAQSNGKVETELYQVKRLHYSLSVCVLFEFFLCLCSRFLDRPKLY